MKLWACLHNNNNNIVSAHKSYLIHHLPTIRGEVGVTQKYQVLNPIEWYLILKVLIKE